MLRGFVYFAMIFFVTALIAGTALFVAMPLVLVVIPSLVLGGIFFAFHGLLMVALICMGYVLFFGVVAAWIGVLEVAGFVGSLSFSLSLIMGLVGYALMFLGVWKAWEMTRNKVPNHSSGASN